MEHLFDSPVGIGTIVLLVGALLIACAFEFVGLPASSSHTLIGAIVGVGLANSLMPGHVFGSGVNWGKVKEIGSSLVFSRERIRRVEAWIAGGTP